MIIAAYGPLTTGQRLDHASLVVAARRLGRTPAQGLLRWVLEQGHTPVVKSAQPVRMRENLALFGSAPDDEARAALAALDEGLVTG